MTQPDPNAQSGTGSAQGGDTGTGDGTGAAMGTDPGTGAQSGAANPAGDPNAAATAETVSKAEYDRRMAQLSAADKRAAAAEATLKQLQEKDMPELAKLTRDNAELQARAEKAEGQLQQTRLENAFYTDNKYAWKNPKAALKLADLSKVEIDDDGKVHNLTAALDALAKSDPYLLAEKPDPDPEPRGATGMPAGGGKPSDGKASLKGLAARIPALRQKGIG